MKKLNSFGFAHHVAIMAVVVVAVIGGIGSYIYLRDSGAASPAASCGSGYSQRKAYGIPGGTMYLSVNPYTRNACAIVTSTTNYGVSKWMRAQILITRKTDGTIIKAGNNDADYYKYFAGPSRVSYDGVLGSKSSLNFKIVGNAGKGKYVGAWAMTDVGTLASSSTTSTVIPTAFSAYKSMNYTDDDYNRTNYGTQQCKVKVSNLIASRTATVTFYFKPSASLLRLAKAQLGGDPSSKLFTARMEAYPTTGGSAWLQNPNGSGSSKVYHYFGSQKTSDGYYTRTMKLYVPVKSGVKFKKFMARYSANHSDSRWVTCNVTKLP